MLTIFKLVDARVRCVKSAEQIVSPLDFEPVADNTNSN